jgi:hypothetical protein
MNTTREYAPSLNAHPSTSSRGAGPSSGSVAGDRERDLLAAPGSTTTVGVNPAMARNANPNGLPPPSREGSEDSLMADLPTHSTDRAERKAEKDEMDDLEADLLQPSPSSNGRSKKPSSSASGAGVGVGRSKSLNLMKSPSSAAGISGGRLGTSASMGGNAASALANDANPRLVRALVLASRAGKYYSEAIEELSVFIEEQGYE